MKVTPIAIEELSKILTETENPEAGVRVFAQDGCCGPGLQMSLEEKIGADDKMLTIENVNFFVEAQAETMLEGVTLDYGPQGFRLEGLKRPGGCC